MRRVFLLQLKHLGRSVDRSTGSPLARWTLLTLLAALPVATLAFAWLAEGGDAADAGSFASASVAAIILAPAITATIVTPLVVAWRLDERLLMLFQTTPSRTSSWQLALLAPLIAAGAWVGLGVAAPLVWSLTTNPAVALPGRLIVGMAVITAIIASATLALVGGLGLRRVLARLPSVTTKWVRSFTAVAVVVAIIWPTVWAWTCALRALSKPGRVGTFIDVAPFASGVVLIVSLIVTRAALRVARWLEFAQDGECRRFVAFRFGFGARWSRPGAVGLAWVRHPQVFSILGPGALLVGVGIAVHAARPLSYVGLFVLSVSLVGFAGGNVSYRTVVATGPGRPAAWFARNVAAAVVPWSVLTVVWTISMIILGESDVVRFAAVATLLAGLSLGLGCAFARSFESALGSEVAQLAAYSTSGAAIAAIGQFDLLAGATAWFSMLIGALGLVGGAVFYSLASASRHDER